MNRKAQTLAVVTSALLIAIVLGTFSSLQNYGPASALRRFHLAIEKRNLAEAMDSIDAPVESTVVNALANHVLMLMGPSRRYRIARMERLPGEVRAIMLYQPRENIRIPMVWVVTQRGRHWKIDTGRTLAILRETGSVPSAL